MEREPHARLLYPVSEAAALLGVQRTMMYKLFAAGRIKRTYVGTKPLVSAQEIARFLAEVTAGQRDEQ